MLSGFNSNFLRRAGGDDPAAGLTAAGAHVDEKVRVADDVEVVLDDHDRCAVVQKRLEDAEQHPHIQRMQADRRFIEDEDRVGLALRPISLASFSRCASPPDRLGVSSPSVR